MHRFLQYELCIIRILKFCKVMSRKFLLSGVTTAIILSLFLCSCKDGDDAVNYRFQIV